MFARERRSGSSCRAADEPRRGAAVVAIALAALASGACERQVVHPVASADDVANLCAGVPDAERDHPSMLQPPELEGVRKSMGERHMIKYSVTELRGAELLVRPSPGISRQWIARVIQCHVAYRDLPGARVPETLSDPLLVDEATVSFGETDTSFVIRIQGETMAEGEEILARAQRLVPQ
jgi:hypothetical protein